MYTWNTGRWSPHLKGPRGRCPKAGLKKISPHPGGPERARLVCRFPPVPRPGDSEGPGLEPKQLFLLQPSTSNPSGPINGSRKQKNLCLIPGNSHLPGHFSIRPCPASHLGRL